MVDQKISGGKAMKLFSKKGKVASTFPNHTQVRDECGVTTSNHQCDYDKSTWKYVILDFYNLDDYSVSSKYSVKNVFGESEPIELVPIVDGAWSDWSDWSSCSKTCLSQKDASKINIIEKDVDRYLFENNSQSQEGEVGTEYVIVQHLKTQEDPVWERPLKKQSAMQ